ncbi:MAG: zinc-dependent alcohol dehydrogenase family protein [Gammaproteobacteria bacterium]|nr:zinc-dependent alcohol dehydrogenase family protein [Gammaproteobacteria bacterium]
MRLLAARSPLQAVELTLPEPAPPEVLISVEACGVCRTDLHLLEAELDRVRYPITPGHEVVGIVSACGAEVERFRIGDRLGVPWLAFTCGVCAYCRRGEENLCPQARFTGYTRDGGYAQQILADARYCLPLPPHGPASELAPLLCAGLIGYRAYRKAGEATNLGLYGFGAAAHLIAQVARHEGRRVFAFTREGDEAGQRFARSLGAVWAGPSGAIPPEPLDAALLFAPVGALIPAALTAVRPGGCVVCAGIHMSDVPTFPYRLLWGERTLSSVANLTRADGEAFLAIAARLALKPTVERFALDEANRALERLRDGELTGAAVLDIAAGRLRASEGGT